MIALGHAGIAVIIALATDLGALNLKLLALLIVRGLIVIGARVSGNVPGKPVSPRAARRRRAFGQRVRRLRAEVGLSQEALAHRAGLDRTYVGSVERGERNISLDNIWLLADTLGVRPSQLID